MAPMVRPKHRGWLLLGLCCLLLANFPYFEATRNANEMPRLMQARALVEAGEWAIDGGIVRGLKAGPDVARSPVDGRMYPNKPPGASVVGAAAYITAEASAKLGDESLTLRGLTWWARLWAGMLPTCLLCLYLHRVLTPVFGRGPVEAGLAWYVLATPAVAYAHVFYGHQLAACLLWVGCGEILRACLGETPRSSLMGFLGGFAASLAIVVEYGAVFAGPVLAVVCGLGWRRGGSRRRAAAWAVVGALVPVAMLASYHRAVFGSPWATGYHHVTNADFAAKHGQGLLGLVAPTWDSLATHILSWSTGLIGWAPAALAGVWGLWLASSQTKARRQSAKRTWARTCLAIFATYVAVTMSLNFTGGWRVGPRYMVAVLPALVVGWCVVASRLPELAKKHAYACYLAMAAVLTYGAVVNGLAANLWPHIDPTNIHHPVSEVLLPLWQAGRGPYGIVSGAGWPVSAVVVASCFVVLWMLGRGCVDRASRVAVLVGAGVGLAGVWATTAIQPHPRSQANLRYIKKVWEPGPDGKPGRSLKLPTERNLSAK